MVSREKTLTVGYERQGLEKGLTQGRVEGRVEGQRAEKIAIARNLVNLGLERAKIAQVTGLALQEIEKLFDSH